VHSSARIKGSDEDKYFNHTRFIVLLSVLKKEL